MMHRRKLYNLLQLGKLVRLQGDMLRCSLILPPFDQVDPVLGKAYQSSTWHKAKVGTASFRAIRQTQNTTCQLCPRLS